MIYKTNLKIPSKLLAITLFLWLSSTLQLHAQNQGATVEKKTYQYYDEDNNSISESAFNDKLDENKWFLIVNDSLGIKKLTETQEKSTLKNKQELIDHLQTLTGKQIDKKKPIIIIYHPGKDPCNSSGSATKETSKIWFDELEKGTRRIAKVEPIYISKRPAELTERDKVNTYYKDEDQYIEKLFFNYHYPCSSFVIISPKGKYYSQFGEFGKEFLWKKLRAMK